MVAANHHLQQAAYLVNLGSHLFSTDNDHQAFGAFRRALDIIQRVANDLDDTSVIEPDLEDIHGARDRSYALPFDSQGKKKLTVGTPEEEDKSYFFIYGQPFVIDPHSLDVSCAPVYLAIVIFDMTLILLRRANQENVKTSWLKALRLSNTALVLLRNAPRHFDASDVLLALLNNKIYVCYCLHEFDEAHSALDEFNETLNHVCTGDTIYDEPELNEMILNTLLPLDPTKVAQAA
jgi:hypothetical protein